VDLQAVQQVLGWALFDAPELLGLLCSDKIIDKKKMGLQPSTITRS
jgi:hypothetical protein